MASGELQLGTYHRAESIGAGSFGSVITVYNDEGERFALKLFECDDDDDTYGIGLGTLREISILRVLREENSHPNIVQIHDIQTSFGEDIEEEVGAGTDGGILAMAMPLYPEGSLADSFAKITSKKQKAVIAYGLLCAVAYLHQNSIMHRDIKSDNVLLQLLDNDDHYEPILIDFSLAKAIHPEVMMAGGSFTDYSVEAAKIEMECTHTSSVGTPTYRAPEVVDEEPYGLSSDLWSVGVVLLELLQGKCLEAYKDKGAIAMIEEALESLPQGQPFPELIRGLLKRAPDQRWTARQALECDLFRKFGLYQNPSLKSKTFRRIFLPSAIPLDSDKGLMEEENNGKDGSHAAAGKENANNLSFIGQTPRKQKVDPILSKRYKFIQKVCAWMEWNNPMTAHSALTYSLEMTEVCEDVDDLSKSKVLLDCIVAAHKFFEQFMMGKENLTAMYQHFASGQEFDCVEYSENESTLLLLMDMCMYPRTIRPEM